MESKNKDIATENESVKKIDIKTPFEAIEFLYYSSKAGSNGINYDNNILKCANFAINCVDSMMKEIENLKAELLSVKPSGDVIENIEVENIPQEIK